MTADQRLDQLEPMLAQGLAQGDRTTAQLTQLRNQVAVVAESVGQHSDSFQFIFKELAAVRDEQAAARTLQEEAAAQLRLILDLLQR
jgi:hypothetical protein